MHLIYSKLSLKVLSTIIIAPLLVYPALNLVELDWDSRRGLDNFMV
jgi:hypothetical protein